MPPVDMPPNPTVAALYTAVGTVHALASGRDGTLWAATAGGALCWSAGRPTPIRWTAADGMASSDVRALEPTTTGAFAATATGLCQLSAAGTISPASAPVGQEMHCLITDTLERRWLGTSQGLFILSKNRPQQRFPGAVWRMAGDGTNTWAAGAFGLIRMEDGHRLQLPIRLEELGTVTALAVGEPGILLASTMGLWLWQGTVWQEVPLPAGSPASHVSALCIQGQDIYAGLYGDGVYSWRSSRWTRLPTAPPQTRFVTALAAQPSGVAVGTLSSGVWDWCAGVWKAMPLPGALPSGDIYALALYHGALWASTFDSGLLRLTRHGETTLTGADGLRAAAPRALVVFQNTLYVRHTTGQVDCTVDGSTWRPAFTNRDLPRSMVSALATDGQHLYVGGWAGWSAWDGQRWEHHDKDPELARQVITAIAARPGEVWIGTQKQGLFRYARGQYTHFFERQGLTDDWITCLAVSPTRVLVGTYTGGLLEESGERFKVRFKPQTFAIRAICLRPDGGSAIAATPLGPYRETPSGWRPIAPYLCGGRETQSLLPLGSGLWIGSRTGLAYLPEIGDKIASTAPTHVNSQAGLW